MKRYEKYKSTGIEWLGDIPEHWEVKRIKNICDYISRGITPTYVEESSFKAINQGTFSKGFFDYENAKFTTNSDKRALAKKEDILLASTGGGVLGKTFYIEDINGYFFADSHVTTLRVNKKQLISKYLYYFFSINYDLINGVLAKGSTNQTELQRDQLMNFHWCTPTITEQTTITNYLDTKTTAIDLKIELLTAKADKYKALRRSLINETVCRGLNPNVPLKDSGIEWIGRIPEHWEVKRMKDIGFLFSGLAGKAGDDFNQDENENNRDFIPFTNIFNNDTINPNVMGKVVVFENEKQNKVRKDDLFFLMSSEDYDGLGKSSLLTVDLKETYLNSFCKGFRITKKQVFPAFLNYQLQSDTFRKVMQIEGKGFTRLNLKSEKVTNFNVFIPKTTTEQVNIVDYLDEKTTQIDTILTNIGEQINKLTQLRKTLINDVVTGKIKVTEDE